MKLGFTGTRESPSRDQRLWLWGLFDNENHGIEVVHHGACVGADLLMHHAATDHNVPVIVHPPTKTDYLAQECLVANDLVTVLPPKPYLVRDRDIVGDTQGLVALPLKREAEGGGTWYTVKFAERMNKPVVICYLNGELERRIPNERR